MLTRRKALTAVAAIPFAAGADSPLRSRSAPELTEAAPAAPREFRAAWIATVANIDWPSKPGLSADRQQAECSALLDLAVRLKLNAVILQVRTSADALYESALEPWSEFLSGKQGQSPGYDPLAFWITEAHRRGLELHAWFNPFRARPSSAKSVLSASHVSRSQPQWVKSYGDQLWIDPGEPAAAEHTLAVFQDVLQRYDIDAIHIDDYFYPYPVTQLESPVDFPDDPSWQRYKQGGGQLLRADWRRSNVDGLIARLHRLIQATKPWVRFGISPFGLPRPALRPVGIAGFSQYDQLFADVERWLHEGWLDYLAPQLYWPMAQQPQAFSVLLDYWNAQNRSGRHIWPGLFTSKVLAQSQAVSWPVAEIEAQIAMVRERFPGSGHIHFSIAALAQNRRGLSHALQASSYGGSALVPATPWLEAGSPAAPRLELKPEGELLRLSLQPGPGKPVARYALWLREGQAWRFIVLDAGELLLPRAGLSGLVASAIDRIGNESPRIGLAID